MEKGVKGKRREKGEGEGKGRDPPAVNPPLLKNPGYGPEQGNWLVVHPQNEM